jgi:hypothetical protein
VPASNVQELSQTQPEMASSDILTQLQICYDQLLTQYFSTVSYLSQRHGLVAPQSIPGDQYTLPMKDDITTKPGPEDTAGPMPLLPVPDEEFESAKQLLAEDLVRKSLQIEDLIRKLPGLGKSEDQQKADIEQLVEQVKEMDTLRKQKRKEMKQCVRRLDEVVLGMSTSINVPDHDAVLTNGHG